METSNSTKSAESANADPNNFSVRITIEFGPGAAKEHGSSSTPGFLEFASADMARHPNSPYFQYLNFLCENYKKFGSKIGPNKISDSYGDCGSCNLPAGGKGRIWYTFNQVCITC